MAETPISEQARSELYIRLMVSADLPLGRRLVEAAGWNQLDADWLRALQLDPNGCFVAEWHGRDVGTTTCCRFGEVGWIAMVLVDADFRGLGIAGAMMRHAIGYMEACGVQSICLDATAMGEKVYTKLGFEGAYEVIRLSREPGGGAGSVPVPETMVRRLAFFDRAASSSLDRLASGGDRGAFLSSFAVPGREVYYQASGSPTEGYACYRVGRNAIQIGPAVAASQAAGVGLLSRVLADCHAERCFIDIPAPNRLAMQWAESNGFKPQRSFIRMFRGERPNDRPELIWASSGPEKG